LGKTWRTDAGVGLAHEVLRHATIGNARTAGLAGRLGAIRPGYKADLIFIDLNDVAYLPYNSAARQLRLHGSRSRRGERHGRWTYGDEDRVVKSIDEDALRREVASLMRHFIADYDAMVKLRRPALDYMLDAHRRMWEPGIRMDRFVGRAR
jgi:5-methylthioadenosine/S-adenosylhomocysteine deaminase